MTALDAHEHAEHAKHAAHREDPFTSMVSITIALLAVAAAITSSLETYESAGAIIAANEAVLAQNKATDNWNLYEAKSLKKNMYVIASDASDAGGPKAAAYAAKAKSEGADQDKSQAEAKGLEADSRRAQQVSQSHEARHHRLTLGATLLEIGIATSTIAIITRRRLPWIASSVLGLVGALVAASAYLWT